MRKQNKYNVSPKDERTYLGRTFGSKAERRYCEQLEMMWEAGVIFDYICQPAVWLGVPENKYKPDFLVVPDGGPASPPCLPPPTLSHPPTESDFRGFNIHISIFCT